MANVAPEHGQNSTAGQVNGSLADDLQGVSAQLADLAAALRAREQALSDREAALQLREEELATAIAERDHFKRMAHGFMVELAKEAPFDLPEGVDLATWAKEQGAVSAEELMKQLFGPGDKA